MGQHQTPESGPVVQVFQMRNLVSGNIIEHESGRENEPPRVGKIARRRARAPATALIADGNTAVTYFHLRGIFVRRHRQLCSRRRPQPIKNPPRNMRQIARHLDEVCYRIDSHGSAPCRDVTNFMINSAQWNGVTRPQGNTASPMFKARSKPCRRALNEIKCVMARDPARHGDNRCGSFRAEPQNQPSRIGMAAEDDFELLASNRQ